MNEMIPTSAAARACEEQQDLGPLHRHADVARRVASPPAAKIQLPNVVRLNSHVPTMVTRMNQMMAVQ